jgi:hypothetical protein
MAKMAEAAAAAAAEMMIKTVAGIQVAAPNK